MSLVITRPEQIQEKIMFFHNYRDKFHVVADFDGTLNHYFDHEWKRSQSIISLLYTNDILDEDYSKHAQAFYDYYVKIEHDSTLPIQTRQAAMEERWMKHKELLMNKWLNYHHLEQIVTLDKLIMRSWTDVFLRSMYDNNIPVVIFSASGVGVDSIGLLLKHRWIDFPNISIVSNKLYRSEDGEMIWYSKPIIHSLNKKESVIWNNPEYKTLQHILSDKPHAIVIGDSLHDVDMVDCRDDRTIVSIGLCNDKIDERIDQYTDAFDIVITHDEWFEEVIEKIGL